MLPTAPRPLGHNSMHTANLPFYALCSGQGAQDNRSLNQMVDDSAEAIVVTNENGIIIFSNKLAADM